MAVSFSDKCGILGQFWIQYRDDENLKVFTEYNDIGLPLAYFIASGLVTANPIAEDYVNESFSMFISALELTEEEIESSDDLNSILDRAEILKDEDHE
jgi:hypothetical protein